MFCEKIDKIFILYTIQKYFIMTSNFMQINNNYWEKSNEISINDFLDSVKNKSDEEIKVIFENCTREELINNLLTFINVVKITNYETKKKSSEVSNLVRELQNHNQSIIDDINKHK